MHPLQGPTGENESMASEHSGQNKGGAWWVGPLAIVGTYVGAYVVASVLLDRDLLRLKGLHLTIKILQGIAREAGEKALTAEQRYNEIVNTLH